jgi:hypothetical protein
MDTLACLTPISSTLVVESTSDLAREQQRTQFDVMNGDERHCRTVRFLVFYSGHRMMSSFVSEAEADEVVTVHGSDVRPKKTEALRTSSTTQGCHRARIAVQPSPLLHLVCSHQRRVCDTYKCSATSFCVCHILAPPHLRGRHDHSLIQSTVCFFLVLQHRVAYSRWQHAHSGQGSLHMLQG